jgi:hypothetical protein
MSHDRPEPAARFTAHVAESRVLALRAKMWNVGVGLTVAAAIVGALSLAFQVAVVAGLEREGDDAVRALRWAIALLGLGDVSIVTALAIAAVVGLASPAALVGLLVGVYTWVRAARAHEPGDLALTIEGRTLTLERGGLVVHRAVPLVGAQVFPDYVHFVAGAIPRVFGIDVPLGGDDHPRLVGFLGPQLGASLGVRPAIEKHLFQALVLFPLVFGPLVLAMIALEHLAGIAVLAGFASFGPSGLVALAVVGVVGGAVVLAARIRRRR